MTTEQMIAEDMRELAEIMHEVQCRWNHVDQCAWHYGSWTRDVTGERLMYLERARQAVKYGVTARQIIRALRAVQLASQ